MAFAPARPGELSGTADRRSPEFVDVPRWEPREPREIIVID